MVTTENYVGSSVLRKEDAKLLTGQGTFIDNQTMAGMAWMEMVRPPYVHARINRIDTSVAESMPGVIAVLTAADLEEAFPSSLPMVWPITEDIKVPTHWPLTKDKVRFGGDAVAVIVAETREQAEDAAEAVVVDATDLPAVLDLEEAAKDEVVIHEDLGTNKVVHWSHGGGGDQSVFESAPVIVQERYTQPRLIPNAIEPRGCLAYGIPAAGEFTLISATQIPHIARVGLSIATGIPQSKLRIIAPDVGGGFGSKLDVYAEEALALALTRRLGRPIKWIEGRQENYVATIHGRGVLHDCTLAGTEDGKILGMKFVELADMGAYFQLLTPGIPELGGWVYMGPYTPEAYWFEFTGIMTNATPTDAYRGAGRPEATFVIERLVDTFARRIGKDPAEVRRMNLHPPFDVATPSIMGLSLDSGNFEPTFDRALELADYDGFRKEQAARRDAGDVRQIGIGLSSYIEMCGLAPSNILGALRYVAGGWDAAEVECRPDGKVVVRTGTSPHGQGHATSWSQIVADGLGVTPDDVDVLHGDTAISKVGMDTYGSRSGAVGGEALRRAVERVREKASLIAAHELEVSQDDLEWTDGAFRVRGAPDKARTIPELAASAWHAHDLPAGVEPMLEGTAVFDPPNFTWPAGTHVCVVEVDTETGATDILRYVASDDCGNVINPMIVDGMVHGGVAQGIAEALYEEAVYDDRGNLMSSSMTQYLVPSAMEIPAFILDRTVTPSTTNGLGVKGIGEAGTIAAPPAVINAVIDAVAHLGVSEIAKPATPERVWRAIRDAGKESRMIPAAFEYMRAESVDHAIDLLSSNEDAKILAGGHSLLPLMRLRLARPSMLIDIGRVPDLSGIRADGDAVVIGALTRHHDVANSEVLQELCPIVAHTAGEIGDPQVRHMGTIGGSIAHADPASDMPTVMVALGAQMVVRGAGGASRTVTAGDFFKGLFTSDLAANEVLTEVRVPATSTAGWSYIKFHRRAQDWALVGVAAVQRNGGAHVALTNMGETPLRATGVEEALNGGADPATAAERADEGVSPPSDAFGSAEYRRELVKVLVRRSLEEALAG